MKTTIIIVIAEVVILAGIIAFGMSIIAKNGGQMEEDPFIPVITTIDTVFQTKTIIDTVIIDNTIIEYTENDTIARTEYVIDDDNLRTKLSIEYSYRDGFTIIDSTTITIPTIEKTIEIPVKIPEKKEIKPVIGAGYMTHDIMLLSAGINIYDKITLMATALSSKNIGLQIIWRF